MAPRSTPPPPKGAFYPPNDAATYRDLLLFEERLKTNAASLKRRKSRYQLFLAQLILIIAFLLSEVLLQTSFLAVPYKWALRHAMPEIYAEDIPFELHPYFASGLLFVAVTTLALFFASGMYSEKIGYANRYVPHANKALRSFNMHLNVRSPPLRSKFPFNPLSFLFPRPTEVRSPSSSPPPTPHIPSSPSPLSGAKRSTSVPIPSIPPATNPRGELIFSSRVDRNFRESYERYRSAFERKREERERERSWNARWGWLSWFGYGSWWGRPLAPSTPVPHMRGHSPGTSAFASMRGRNSGTGTPSGTSSRRSSPVPGKGSGSGSRSGTPPTHSAHARLLTADRASDRLRTESFSFLLADGADQ